MRFVLGGLEMLCCSLLRFLELLLEVINLVTTLVQVT